MTANKAVEGASSARLCDVCRSRPDTAVRASYLGPVSWGFCKQCLDESREPPRMIMAALAMWHRRALLAEESELPRLTRRLLTILHAPTYVGAVPGRGYLIRLGDSRQDTEAADPAWIASAALRALDAGDITRGEVIVLVEAEVRAWWSSSRT